MLLQAEPIFVAKGLVVADHRDPADRIMIIKTGVVELCLAIDSKVWCYVMQHNTSGWQCKLSQHEKWAVKICWVRMSGRLLTMSQTFDSVSSKRGIKHMNFILTKCNDSDCACMYCLFFSALMQYVTFESQPSCSYHKMQKNIMSRTMLNIAYLQWCLWWLFCDWGQEV